MPNATTHPTQLQQPTGLPGRPGSRGGRRVRSGLGALLRLTPVLVLCSMLLAPSGAAAQSQLVWENVYGNGATATPVVIDGTTVSISGVDAFGVGSPGNFTVNHATRGAHAGYWESGLDANSQAELMTIALAFSQQVESLEFSLLDIDTNFQFHDSITVVGWNGTTAFAPTTVSLGGSVEEVDPGVYSGLASIGNSSAGANVDLRFDQLVDSVTFVYGPGPKASADPALQVMGISDLSWTLPCLSTLVVSTTAELRAAVANPCVLLVLMNPGLYDLTASGSGTLDIDQDKTLRNVGGGEVVIDGAGSSRVIDVSSGNAVELDGLTVTGGSTGGNGSGIGTRGDLTVRNSTVTGNAGNRVGGIYHREGTLLLQNVTVSGNTGSRGSGLDLRAGARLEHVTVADNQDGGGIRSRSSSVTLVNTLVADNVGGGIEGTITSLGGNLVEGGCAGCGASDLTGDPDLLPLTLNGGDSRTHALAPASIAIDAANASFGLPTDQRGVGRPVGGGFDIGAYEAPVNTAVTVTADATTADRLPSNGTTYVETFSVDVCYRRRHRLHSGPGAHLRCNRRLGPHGHAGW
mgnify:FL=1